MEVLEPTKLACAVALRRTQRLGYEPIAERVGLSRSVVARACKAAGRHQPSAACRLRRHRHGDAASAAGAGAGLLSHCSSMPAFFTSLAYLSFSLRK